MNNMTVKSLGMLLILGSLHGCSSTNSTHTRAGQPTTVSRVTESDNPDGPNYWNNAKLVWSDEFEGDSLSPDYWTFETGNSGWGNNELQNYRASGNVEIVNGVLKLTAKINTDSVIVGDFTSARLNSKKSFKYGRMEIRAKMPEHKGSGLWPALWMLGENINTLGWPACGEIDILEYVSFKPDNVHFAIHSPDNNHTNATEISSGAIRLETVEESFHNYGILWTSEYIKFYVDEVENIQFVFRRPEVATFQNWPFSNAFYFLMNIAVGGNWGGLEGVDIAIFPATMEVDYVRVYQVY